MDQFFLDSVALIGFMAIWFAFAIIIFFMHYIYRLCKTKKIVESFLCIAKIHVRMFSKLYITTMLFFVFCAVLKSIVE